MKHLGLGGALRNCRPLVVSRHHVDRGHDNAGRYRVRLESGGGRIASGHSNRRVPRANASRSVHDRLGIRGMLHCGTTATPTIRSGHGAGEPRGLKLVAARRFGMVRPGSPSQHYPIRSAPCHKLPVDSPISSTP